MSTMNRTFTWMVAGVALLSGCTVGPKYQRPTYPAPPAFRGADAATVTSDAQASLGDQQWAQVFREPELQELIRKALTNNYDLRIAAQRILEQRAQVQITRSQQFPSLTVGGTGIGADIPSLNSNSGSGSSSNNNTFSSPIVEGSFSFSAAWNPDFWGLYRKQTGHCHPLIPFLLRWG
jgi:multidrug efflux system outer membrane protein